MDEASKREGSKKGGSHKKRKRNTLISRLKKQNKTVPLDDSTSDQPAGGGATVPIPAPLTGINGGSSRTQLPPLDLVAPQPSPQPRAGFFGSAGPLANASNNSLASQGSLKNKWVTGKLDPVQPPTEVVRLPVQSDAFLHPPSGSGAPMVTDLDSTPTSTPAGTPCNSANSTPTLPSKKLQEKSSQGERGRKGSGHKGSGRKGSSRKGSGHKGNDQRNMDGLPDLPQSRVVLPPLQREKNQITLHHCIIVISYCAVTKKPIGITDRVLHTEEVR